MHAMPRPTLNLDPIAKLLDLALRHPLAAKVKEHAPELHAVAVDVRDHLPDVAAHLFERTQERAFGGMKEEARALERDAVDAMQKWLGRKPAKRLKAPKRKARSA